MSMQVKVIAGPDCGRAIPMLPGAALTVGRGSECVLRLTDPSVSRLHCELLMGQGDACLVDAGSRYGTFLNGSAVSRCRISAGDRIEVGDTVLEVGWLPAAVQTQLPTRGPVSTPQRELEQPAEREAPANLRDLVGSTIADCRLLEVKAEGAWGVLFRGLDVARNRPVAFKAYSPGLFADRRSVERFLRSMKSFVPLKHDNLVKLHAAGRSQGVCFTVAEWIDGESMAERVEKYGIAGMLDWRTAWTVGIGLASALEYLHARRIVHRSVTPHNIWLRSSDGLAKLGDSMVAKAMDGADPSLTQRGEIVGELPWLSPEHITSPSAIGERSDLYSLGATLYTLLCGRPPFEGHVQEVISQILVAEPEPPTRRHLGIHPHLEGVVLRLLAKRPEERYSSAAQLRADLQVVTP